MLWPLRCFKIMLEKRCVGIPSRCIRLPTWTLWPYRSITTLRRSGTHTTTSPPTRQVLITQLVALLLSFAIPDSKKFPVSDNTGVSEVVEEELETNPAELCASVLFPFLAIEVLNASKWSDETVVGLVSSKAEGYCKTCSKSSLVI